MSSMKMALRNPTAASRQRCWAVWTATSRRAPIIEAQDRDIGEKSGIPRMPIKSIHRAGEKLPEESWKKVRRRAS